MNLWKDPAEASEAEELNVSSPRAQQDGSSGDDDDDDAGADGMDT